MFMVAHLATAARHAAGAAAVAAAATVAAACGGASAQTGDLGTRGLPKDDPAHGIYNYESARRAGIPVHPTPPADKRCPRSSYDWPGYRADQVDTPEELAALGAEMDDAPECEADPRDTGVLYVLGYRRGYSRCGERLRKRQDHL
jgi:hypothetical protein